MKKFHLPLAVLAALVVVAVGLTGCGALDSSGTAADRAAQHQKKDKADKPANVKQGPQGTTSQEQALGSANDYLDGQAFSQKGLVEQLQYEDFSKADAIWAASHVKTNWNHQAALTAKQYLEHQHFSRQGLIDQLKYEGYTPAQAIYGVKQAGL